MTSLISYPSYHSLSSGKTTKDKLHHFLAVLLPHLNSIKPADYGHHFSVEFYGHGAKTGILNLTDKTDVSALQWFSK